MRPTRFAVVVVFALMSVAALASQAQADGCYMPVQAYRRMPEIVAQRAVLSWKDGLETLVIESALDSESQTLGWLIPVPAVPQTIEKAGPGMLKTLDFCIQPEITNDLWPQIKIVIWLMLVLNLLGAMWFFYRKRFLEVLFLVLVLFLLASALLPAGGMGRLSAAKKADVLVEKTVAVGSYDVNVLRPTKPEELNAWLRENGFTTLPGSADPTVDDYIAQGWVFAAIKLTRAEAGANAPHPIKLVFPAKAAVYPLRLTAFAGGSPEFAIFVIADEMAACDQLPVEFCDRFIRDQRGGGSYVERTDTYIGTMTGEPIGHPGIGSLMWGQCVLTKLSGTIPAQEMRQDLRFERRSFMPEQQHFYTGRGARSETALLCIGLAGASLFLSMWMCRARIVQPGGLRGYVVKVLLPGAALLGLGAGILWMALPRIGDSEVLLAGLWRSHSAPYLLRNSIESLLKNNPQVLYGTDQQIAEYLLKHAGDDTNTGGKLRNDLLDQELRVEDSPGNFTVEKQAGKVVVRVYDAIGKPLLVEQPVP